jgi:glycosyltransferase involved in cell wall biosynthesis
MERMLVGIAARNEEEGLRVLLPPLSRIASSLPMEVDLLVIDDGSSDATQAVALDHRCKVIRYEDSVRGNGRARKATLQRAVQGDYDYVVTMDGDGQHHPEHIELLSRELLKGTHYVRASRFHPSLSKHFHSLPPQWLEKNREVTEAANRMTGWNLTDALCGMMGLPVFIASSILSQLKWDHYGFAIEVLSALSERIDADMVKEIPHAPIYDLTEKMKRFYDEVPAERLQRYNEHLAQIDELSAALPVR